MKENSITFSLILATVDRTDEVRRFFDSIVGQCFPKEKIEVIVLDQNIDERLDTIIDEFRCQLRINHIPSNIKGLSYNRNIGLEMAKGKYVCFPDDDCTYYPDTLSSVLKCFEKYSVGSVFGAIRDRATGENIIREWPVKDKMVTRWNFFWLYSSITMFTKNKSLRFDDNLGAGCYFGSCEDSDYSYSLIKSAPVYYCGGVEVWHPKIGLEQFTQHKNISYSLGFGGFCGKYWKDFYILRLFFMALVFHSCKAFFSLLKCNSEGFSARKDAVLYRLRGFFEYLKK